MDENDSDQEKAVKQEELHEQAEEERRQRIEEKKKIQAEIRQKIKDRKRREEKEEVLASREQELEERAQELEQRAELLQQRADELEEKNRQLEEEARARELAAQEEEASKISLFDDDDEEEEDEDFDSETDSREPITETETETDAGINLEINEDETAEFEFERPGGAQEGELSATVVGVSLDELIDTAKQEQARPERHDNCNFCKVVSGSMDVSVLYQDEVVTAFLHIMPISLAHVLVVPNRHIRSIDELDDATSDVMFRVARMICRAIESSDVSTDGMAIYLSDFLEADPEARHVYINVIPRNIGDGIGLKFKQQAKMGSKQLNQLRDIIKAKM